MHNVLMLVEVAFGEPVCYLPSVEDAVVLLEQAQAVSTPNFSEESKTIPSLTCF